eukprot:CAMPEP_0169205144 /NCGR_PEP_ID=MMETSP1016-20121227/12362_1 /TAXON_ID=342587 /ORGANISM="Karlodinium micrum, Strain CCMP2283" /LENGTH=358 /DNA_ID=CAMNT_0009282273 /DNA_START=1 /DNA_END=1077 /DNA_ORIENTATION=+
MTFPTGFVPKASIFHGAFCGSPLNRTTSKKHKEKQWECDALQSDSTLFLLFSSCKGSTGAAPFLLKERPLPPTIAWQTRTSLESMGVEPVEHRCDGVPPILLGELNEHQHFAILVDKSEEDLIAHATCPHGKKPFVAEGMSQLLRIGCDEGDFNTIGHAFAKIVWHKKTLFCSSCGNANISIECGLKRQCPSCNARVYPRTESSCMALVRNEEDNKCLLISGQDKSSPHMWTCVSGFVEQCEQVEEAAKREVWEETGVEIDLSKGADWLGSQPWPLGIGGQCELMLGLEVVALSEKIDPNLNDVMDARWFTRQEVDAMLNTPWNREGKPFVPPFISEAHFLLQRWVGRESKAQGGYVA